MQHSPTAGCVFSITAIGCMGWRQSDDQVSPSDSPASSSFVVLEPETVSQSAPEPVPEPVKPAAASKAADPVVAPKLSNTSAEPSSRTENANGVKHEPRKAVDSPAPAPPPKESKPLKVAAVEPIVKAAEAVPEAVREVAAKALAPAPVDEETAKKRQNVFERVVWTFIMISGFVGKCFAYRHSRVF